MVPSEFHHLFPEHVDLPVFLKIPPVQPGTQVVLAIGIVVALLGIPKFIPHKDQWGRLGKQQHTECILDQLQPQAAYPGLAACPLLPAVPAAVIVISVPVILPVASLCFWS